MHRFFMLVMVSAVFITVPAESAKAQRYPSTTRRPRQSRFQRNTLSPYLDLLGGGRNNRGLTQDYFRRFRPEMELRRENAQLSQSIEKMNAEMATQRQMRLQQQQRQMRPAGIHFPIASGHPTSFLRPSSRFFNYGGYYK